MNLYRIQGGVGHNFPIGAFQDTGSLNTEQPVQDGSILVNAGVRLGMPDQFTYTIDGALTIKTGGQDSGARVDFSAWLLEESTGQRGRRLPRRAAVCWRQLRRTALGRPELHGRRGLGESGYSIRTRGFDALRQQRPWHIYAGQKQGPRIQGTLPALGCQHVCHAVRAPGSNIGGSEGINLTVGSSGVASAWVNAQCGYGAYGHHAAAAHRGVIQRECQCRRLREHGHRRQCLRVRGRLGADSGLGDAG
jgi:hypothetical protein